MFAIHRFDEGSRFDVVVVDGYPIWLAAFTNMAPVLFKDPTLHASLDRTTGHAILSLFLVAK